MRYYLGIDNGGTTTKAALFDRNGHEISVASVQATMLTPQPGVVERDMEEMWKDNCRVIRDVLERSGVKAESIAGVGVCGHGKGLYLWGKEGKPVRNGIVSTDNRAYLYPVKWRADGTEEKAFERTCQHIMSCQPVALLAWLRDHEQENYEEIQWIFECKDYIRFCLTGEARAELTDYSGTGLLNLYTRDYDNALLELFGLESIKHALPLLCRSTDICGYVTSEAAAECGLKVGTPVIGGMFDIDACALAVGVTNEENICMIAGTWSINEYLRKEPVTDGSVLMNSLFCMPEYYLIEESSPTSAGNNEWFINQLLPEVKASAKAVGRSVYDELNHWVESIRPEEFIPIFLPFLMASNVHPNAKGSFVGLTASHTREHMLRSVYEGITFCHKYHVEKLLQSREKPPKCVRLAGGAVHSAVWSQMFADVLQLPVETVSVSETGALGCAIAVAAALGDYSSLDEAARNMCPVTGTIFPNENNRAIYDTKYRLYKRLIECLDPLWSEMQEALEGNYAG